MGKVSQTFTNIGNSIVDFHQLVKIFRFSGERLVDSRQLVGMKRCIGEGSEGMLVKVHFAKFLLTKFR